MGAPNPYSAYKVELVSAPAGGSATAIGTGIYYTPAPGYSGWDGFRYRIVNTDFGGFTEGWADIHVAPPAFSTADAARILRVAGGLAAFSSGDERLDLVADGRLTAADAAELLRGLASGA